MIIFSCLLAIMNCQTHQISITQPHRELIDQEINIQIENLTPFQKIKLEARAEDQKAIIWSSQAFFLADETGHINVASSPTLEDSSYPGTDAMGLFWSMLPMSGDPYSIFSCKNDRFDVEIKLFVENQLCDTKNITRYLKKPNIKRIDLRENCLIGTFFVPLSEKPLPVIITLSGSSGGLSESRAKLLASNGFNVLALAYFGIEGLPSHLESIPLEYFEKAIAWIKSQDGSIDSTRIGLYGVSRGAELALILGSIFPNSIQAIVAALPSSVVYGSYGGSMNGSLKDAWIYQGKPIHPFAPVAKTDFSENMGKTSTNPVKTSQDFLEGMKESQGYEAAAIHVENILSPLLLISGGDDQMWPSTLFSNQIVSRLKTTSSKICCFHLNYPEAGHGINLPNLPIACPTYYHPMSNIWLSMGGTRQADAKASQDSWKKLVVFFHDALSHLSP
jgi:dienelactone hydrolase